MTVFCLYNEIGYFTNEILWETGRACSKPADCTTYKSTKCEDGLCVKAFEKPGKMESLSNPNNGASNQCSGADGMTDSVRNKFLNMNNEYRSLVAKGKAEDKLGGFAPKAAKMPKMKYECALEALAMKHAKRCRYEHSPDYTRPGIGENIFQVSIPNFDKTRAAQMASELWFGELKKFGVGKENKFTAKIRNRPKMPIGHYTQV
ncbi:SCP-like protein [Ancylostoma ceylanicum]|uniref:SCP-like protein n=1 Tax=Ancylostoma ceylanicum TaxID=53326 RepID=A0A0D6LAI6_9BILA|nr:SCP-like protein [Ancylostoma ceylanicum]